jgi:hypothetical protein
LTTIAYVEAITHSQVIENVVAKFHNLLLDGLAASLQSRGQRKSSEYKGNRELDLD